MVSAHIRQGSCRCQLSRYAQEISSSLLYLMSSGPASTSNNRQLGVFTEAGDVPSQSKGTTFSHPRGAPGESAQYCGPFAVAPLRSLGKHRVRTPRPSQRTVLYGSHQASSCATYCLCTPHSVQVPRVLLFEAFGCVTAVMLQNIGDGRDGVSSESRHGCDSFK